VEYAQLGQSDLKISRVVLGAWAIGGWKWGGADDEESVAAIRRALDLGVSTVDTAPVYGFGHSERIVGEAIKGRREEVVIATKCGLRWDTEEGERYFDTADRDGNPLTLYKDLRPDSIREEIDRSLQRLSVDYVDLYQCHWPDSTTPLSETMGALVEILEQGKARAIGVSNFAAHMIEEARGQAPIASGQPLYNMLDREIEQDLLPYCAAHDVGVIGYSSLHMGLLTGKVTMERTFPGDDVRNIKPWFKPTNRRRALQFVERLRPIAEAHDRTLAQLAVNWCLCQRGITGAIVGARRPAQVEENVGGAGWRLTDEELSTIRGWLEELGGPEE
jgi:aryl-alcohol dehydrogenase-like predicted oxidoreductase